MISKSKNLVAVFTCLFVLLMSIQTYFLVKSYQLKEKEITQTVRDKLSKFTDKLENRRLFKKISDDSLQSFIFKYNNKEISKKEFFKFFDDNRKKNMNFISETINEKFKEENYKIAFKIEYSSIVYTPTKRNLIDKPIVLYETNNKVTNPKTINTGNWESSSTTSNKEDSAKITNSISVKSATCFEILNIKSILFKELAILIISCVLLLIAVLLLYIFTIKNLIKQQKEVEILHTVVDNISHEFKTPIATLKIATKTLKKESDPKILPLMERQIDRLEKLMFQIHKDESENETLKIKPKDWDFLIQDLAFVNPEIQFNLKNNTSQELPFDKNLMETIVKNLCENSVKYDASVVEIHIQQLTNQLIINISDDGIGIKKGELKNIFIKFYRIQKGNIYETKGLGLGLYFVQKIVEKYKGTIAVENLEKGIQFKIELPYAN